MKHFRTRIKNATSECLVVHVEPWGDQITLLPDAACRLEFESPKQGEAEIHIEPGNVMVYGWEGCIARHSEE
jgi:hypothetical protein